MTVLGNEVRDFSLLKSSKSPSGRLGTAGLVFDNTLGAGGGNNGIAIAQNHQPINFIGVAENKFYNHRRNIDLLNTGANLNIGSNYFELKRTVGGTTQIGIRATDCEWPNVTTNQFVGLPAAISGMNTTVAIRLRNTPNATIECNDMDYTGVGIQFDGENPTADDAIRTNRFHRHATGIRLLRFGDDGFIGNVGTGTRTNGNIFISTDPFYESSYTSNTHTFVSNNTGVAPPQFFFYEVTDGGDLAGGNPGQFAFQPDPITGDRFDCTANFEAMFGSMEEGGGSGERMMAENVATGEAFVNVEPEYRDVVKYEREKSTFRKLVQKEELRTESEVLEEFYDEKQAAAVGKMDEMKRAMQQLGDSAIVNDSALFFAKVAELQAKQTTLATTESFEYNEKRVAEIYTNTIATGIPLYKDEADKSYINWLAHQCPLVEGHSVYEARGLYAQINPNEDYDDDVLCDGMFKKEREKQEDIFEITNNISLRPNPAKHYTTWFYNLDEAAQAQLTVYNNLGQVVYQSQVPTAQNSFTVYVGNLASGVYQYVFMVNGAKAKIGKLTVTR